MLQTPHNKGRRYPAEVLTPDEVRALLLACSGRAPAGIRNRALLALMYRAALRLGEALALLPKDLDLRAGTIRVLHGKGDRDRTVGIDPGALAVLEHWMGVRARLPLASSSPLFCTLRGGCMDSSYVRAVLPKLARKAGIAKRVHAHGLRHTHAAELAAEGIPMNLIQAQLGHSSLATTSRYLDHIAPTQLIEAMRARRWQLWSPTDFSVAEVDSSQHRACRCCSHRFPGSRSPARQMQMGI